MEPWTRLEILVTTICDRTCPQCCYRIPKHTTLAAEHYDWPVFERTAEAFQGMAQLYVSGGEATLHPQFPQIASRFRELFNPKCMILVTNGARLIHHNLSVELFDRVWITNFQDMGTPNAVSWFKRNHPDKLMLADAMHLPIDQPGAGRRCSRYGFVASAGGRAWPCCVGPGLIGAPSVPIQPGCLAALASLQVPCDSCAFSL